jgi:NitT/TauT family transport system ATP-binding protein
MNLTALKQKQPAEAAHGTGIAPEKRKRIPATKGHVEIDDVSIQFGTGAARNVAVMNAGLDVRPGEFVCLLGPSGCGKSTLLNSVAGFVKPTRGEIRVDGAVVRKPGPERGMVFQQHSLFPWKTVQENVAFGPLMAGANRAAAESVARTFLGIVGLLRYADHFPATLSGGMQQRVGIARALANYPSVLLMDEPFGALDAQTRAMMQENLLELWSEFGTTVLFVTHDIDEAIFLGDRVVVMSASPGRVIEDIPIGLPRPRRPEVVTDDRFVKVKRRCLELIRQETLCAFSR